MENKSGVRKLVCEMCGSNDIVKKDGMYVCQFCETKYTVEEAKKMMVQGNVEVNAESVTIISGSDDFETIFNNAMILLGENYKEGLSLCNKAIAIEPNNYEAWALKAKYLISGYDINAIVNALNKVKEFTPKDNVNVIADDIITYYISHVEEYSFMTVQSDYPQLAKYYLMLNSVLSPKMKIEAADKILGLFHNGKIPAVLYNDETRNLERQLFEKRSNAWREGGEKLQADVKKPLSYEEDMEKEFNELTNEFKIERTPQTSGGCYIATCVYGSYDCPEVWTLRRYRDNTLAEVWYGRVFIRTYYALSPILVKWLGKRDWFKKLWKGKLDYIVEKLNADGIESTPYEDKNW